MSNNDHSKGKPGQADAGKNPQQKPQQGGHTGGGQNPAQGGHGQNPQQKGGWGQGQQGSKEQGKK